MGTKLERAPYDKCVENLQCECECVSNEIDVSNDFQIAIALIVFVSVKSVQIDIRIILLENKTNSIFGSLIRCSYKCIGK